MLRRATALKRICDRQRVQNAGTSVWHRMHDKYEYSLYGYICVCMVF